MTKNHDYDRGTALQHATWDGFIRDEDGNVIE